MKKSQKPAAKPSGLPIEVVILSALKKRAGNDGRTQKWHLNEILRKGLKKEITEITENT